MKVIFEGYLNKLYPDGIELFADTVMDVLSGLKYFPGFRPEDKVRHTVKIKGFETLELLNMQANIDHIVITPVLQGAGGGGAKQLLIGALLIAVSFIFPPAGLIAKGLFLTGVNLAIGGAIQLLMPAAEPPSVSSSGTGSLFFSSTHNTVQIGTTIPLLVGKFKVFGQYLSFDIDAKDFQPA